MSVIDYARKNIVFARSSPIQGVFDENKYRFISDPLLAIEDIDCKCLVWYKPTQAMGTVGMQIATAYRLDVKRKSVMCVAQTDADAKDFSLVKLKPFLEGIPSLVQSVRAGRYSITQDHWLWPLHELLINGPGQNATESKSVPYLHTDEAHLWCLTYPGALEALENRMGDQWDRGGLHVTTAADAGTEIDQRFHLGRQNEWHQSCPACGKLIWPLWFRDERNPYNGVEVFHYTESGSETSELDSVRMICPHCSEEIFDTHDNRRYLDAGAKYIAMNPTADKIYNSFRWNCFAPRWKKWRDQFAKYNRAVHKAKLGDLKPWQDWVKKQEVRTNTGDFPILDRSTVYITHDWKEGEDVCRFGAGDYQAGKEGEGVHWWVGVDEYAQSGDSKRIAYEKVFSWSDVAAFFRDNSVQDTKSRPYIGIDSRYQEKEVYGQCARNKWYAMKGSHLVEFEHVRQPDPRQPAIRFQAPYSEPWRGNPTIGQKVDRPIMRGRVALPENFCLGIYWSNPTIYSIFYNLVHGKSSRVFSIPAGFSKDYIDQYQAFIPFRDSDKVKAFDKPTSLRTEPPQFVNIKPGREHAWDIGCEILTLAILNGYFPLDITETTTEIPHAQR